MRKNIDENRYFLVNAEVVYSEEKIGGAIVICDVKHVIWNSELKKQEEVIDRIAFCNSKNTEKAQLANRYRSAGVRIGSNISCLIAEFNGSKYVLSFIYKGRLQANVVNNKGENKVRSCYVGNAGMVSAYNNITTVSICIKNKGVDEWISLKAWNSDTNKNFADRVAKLIDKGDLFVAFGGEVKEDCYIDKNGNPRVSKECNIYQVQLLRKKGVV